MFNTSWLYKHRLIFIASLASAIVTLISELIGVSNEFLGRAPSNQASDLISWLNNAAFPWVERNFGLIQADAASLLATLRPLLVFAVALSLTWAALRWWPLRKLPELLFPEPPHFLAKHVFDRSADQDDASAPGRPFLCRDAELSKLNAFASASSPFSWWSVFGPTGIGKTRLSFEWLTQLSERSWDIGILPYDSTAAQIRSWKPRRSTAIVIDEAFRVRDSLSEVLAAFATVATPRARIRVLVLDTGPVLVPAEVGPGLKRMLEQSFYVDPERDGPDVGIAAPALMLGIEQPPCLPLHLRPIDVTGAISAFRRDFESKGDTRLSASALQQETGGIPAYLIPLLEGRNPIEILHDRADKVLAIADRVAPGQGKSILTYAALAGPIDAKHFMRSPSQVLDRLTLSRIFPGESWRAPAAIIPAVVPGRLASRVILRGIHQLGEDQAQLIMASAFGASPAASVHRTKALIEDCLATGSLSPKNFEDQALPYPINELVRLRGEHGPAQFAESVDAALKAVRHAAAARDRVALRNALVNVLAMAIGPLTLDGARVVLRAIAETTKSIFSVRSFWRGQPAVALAEGEFYFSRTDPIPLPVTIFAVDGAPQAAYIDVSLDQDEFVERVGELYQTARSIWTRHRADVGIGADFAEVAFVKAEITALSGLDESGTVKTSKPVSEDIAQLLGEVAVELDTVLGTSAAHVSDKLLFRILRVAVRRLAFQVAAEAENAAFDEFAGYVDALKDRIGSAPDLRLKCAWAIALVWLPRSRVMRSNEGWNGLANAMQGVTVSIDACLRTEAAVSSLSFVNVSGLLIAVLQLVRRDVLAERVLSAEFSALSGRVLAMIPRIQDASALAFVAILSVAEHLESGVGSADPTTIQQSPNSESGGAFRNQIVNALFGASLDSGRHQFPNAARVFVRGTQFSEYKVQSGLRSSENIGRWLELIDLERREFLKASGESLVAFEHVSWAVNFMGQINWLRKSRSELLSQEFQAVSRRVQDRLDDFLSRPPSRDLGDLIGLGMTMFSHDVITSFSEDRNMIHQARTIIRREVSRPYSHPNVALIANLLGV